MSSSTPESDVDGSGRPDALDFEGEESMHLNVSSNTTKASSNLHQHLLDRPSLARLRRLSDQESVLSNSSEHQEGGRTASIYRAPESNGTSCSPVGVKSSKGSWHAFWLRQKGVALVLLSQFFGGLMNVTTRLLETDGEGLHPLQVRIL